MPSDSLQWIAEPDHSFHHRRGCEQLHDSAENQHGDRQAAQRPSKLPLLNFVCMTSSTGISNGFAKSTTIRNSPSRNTEFVGCHTKSPWPRKANTEWHGDVLAQDMDLFCMQFLHEISLEL
jgi:hypothetical protein